MSARRFTVVLLPALLLGVACTTPYPFKKSRTTSASMEPTIPKGTEFVWRRFVPGEEKKVLRGDIIVFELPMASERHPVTGPVLHVKRVIGLPGESVALVEDVVWIDGKPLNAPWARPMTPQGGLGETVPPYDVPSDALYVLGDNRRASSDSRVWGALPIDKVRGIVSRETASGSNP